MSKHAITCNALTIKRGKFTIENLDLEIPKGYITGLVGRNGAGKSTLIEALGGALSEKSGTILFEGDTRKNQELQIKKKVSIVYDSPNFSQHLKAKKIAKYVKIIEPDFNLEYFDKMMSRLGLDPNRKIKHYSMGMKKQFMLILAISRNPEILILDEPTSNVDPVTRVEMLDMIQEFMLEENRTVLFSTHITSDLDKIADYIVMLDKGKLAFFKEKEELQENFYREGKEASIEEIMYDTVKGELA